MADYMSGLGANLLLLAVVFVGDSEGNLSGCGPSQKSELRVSCRSAWA